MVRMNEDKLHVKEIENALRTNGGYCPCKVTQNEDTKCMCKEFRDQVKQGQKGFCHCKLYQNI